MLHRYRLLIIIAASVFVFDQLSKIGVVCTLTQPTPQYSDASCLSRFLSDKHPYPTEPASIIGETLVLPYVENPGAAWGILQRSDSPWRTPFFLVISIIAVFFIAYYYHRTPLDNWILRSALGLVLGGAIGNFFDRLRLSYVIDFIKVDLGFWPAHPWPTFNLADSAITVGVIAILVDGLFIHREEPVREKGKGKRT